MASSKPEILVVEDEKKVAKALEEGLEAEHYEVAVAHTGEDGFYLISTQAFDLVLLDLMLPGVHASSTIGRPGAGPGLTLSFLLVALTCGFAALCYAELASMIPIAGSAYTYTYATMGELVAAYFEAWPGGDDVDEGSARHWVEAARRATLDPSLSRAIVEDDSYFRRCRELLSRAVGEDGAQEAGAVSITPLTGPTLPPVEVSGGP